MKAAAILTAGVLLTLAVPVGEAVTEEEIVQIVLDHLQGIIDEPCVRTDTTQRPLDLGESPDVDSWTDPVSGDVFVTVSVPGTTVQAQVDPDCIEGKT